MLLREGETILTGTGALAQIRLLDGGLMSVRADTEMKVDRFAHAGQDDRNSSLLISLLKGGFRSITGLIGQLNRDGYQITTPTATIGIRGTDHEPVVVLPETAALLQVPAGTFERVNEGQTVVRSQGQEVLVNANQFVFVPAQGGPPVLLPTPPAIYRTPTPVPQTTLQQPPRTPAAQSPGAGGDGKAATPGSGARQAGTGVGGPARATPIESLPGASDSLRDSPRVDPGVVAPGGARLASTPIQTGPAIQQAPATLQTAPGIQPATPMIQQAPTTIQIAPVQTAPIQQVPMMSPALKAPTAPVAPSIVK